MFRYVAVLLLTLATFITPAFAAVPSWKINPQKSRLSWMVYYNHQTIKGDFIKLDGDIHFDPDQLEKSNFTITIDLDSVLAQSSKMEKALKGPYFFNIAHFPKAVYKSGKITATSQGYVAHGTFSLAGVTKPLALPFKVVILDNHEASAEGHFSLSRHAFNVGHGPADQHGIGDRVNIVFTLDAIRED